jgi:hypothetical protein
VGFENVNRFVIMKNIFTKIEKRRVKVSPDDLDLLRGHRAFVASVPEKYKHINFKPPAGAASDAKKAIRWKEEHGSQVKGGTAVGWTRARQLVDGDEMSVETVRRMYKFFQRHEKNKAVKPEFRDEPWRDNGYVAWLIWGGDAGKRWAEKLWNQMEAADEKEKQAKDKPLKRTYGKGLTNKEKGIAKREMKTKGKLDEDNPDAYKEWESDRQFKERGKKTKPSKHTKEYQKRFGKSSATKALKNKAKESGIDYGTLKKVYDRGLAAWRTGHRPGTTPHQWAMARVNSFITGGKTRSTTDKDLWEGRKKKSSQPLRNRRDYGERGHRPQDYTQEEIEYMARMAKGVNPYLNTPPTKLKRDLKNVKNPKKRKEMTEALNAWRLTVPGPWRVNAAARMIRLAKILLRR